uniref:Transcription elongation factor 1 homolog n=1 Tax=Fundulus heteroclitus TaxID=8078 RepID=A0A3Q2QK63_FUNHE
MGRRKSKRKPPPKKKMTGDLETQFTCPFCNHEKSCDVKMERSRNTGVISCSVCLEEFQTPITCILCTKWIMAHFASKRNTNDDRALKRHLTLISFQLIVTGNVCP